MNTMELVHFVSTGERPPQRPLSTTAPQFSELMRPARGAMVRARQFLLSAQRSDGAWHSPQSSDASLASQLIFLLAYREDEHTSLTEQAAATILAQQSRDGGWPRLPGGPADLSISVQAYFALKLTGLAPNDERMSRARVVIRQLGGADAADTITRYFLALFGQIGYDFCPVVRPESSLRRQVCTPILAPLALVWSHRAVRQVGMERGVRELFIAPPSDWPPSPPKAFANGSRKPVPRLRVLLDSTLSAILDYCDRMGWTPLRNLALQRTESTLLQNIEPSFIARLDFGELVWHDTALRAVGFSQDSREVQICEKRLDELAQGDDDSSRAQPRVRCTVDSDTIVALQALGASGLSPNHPCAADAAKWLRKLDRHNRTRLGAIEVSRLLHAACDAAENRSPSELLPRIHVMRDCAGHSRLNPHRVSSRLRRFVTILIRHLVEQQNPDGGWGSASGGPSVSDATAAVLEVLASADFESSPRDLAKRPHGMSQALIQAVKFLRLAQRADGSWDSATGVRFVHGTALAVRGLLAAGVPRDNETVAAGINWLIVHQHASGGWGESIVGDRGEFVAGPATASQTAWALLALVAADRSSSEGVRRGIHFLLETQDDDGSWHEMPFVHVDTASARWFRSDLRSVADPLLALSHWAVAAEAAHAEEMDRVPLRLVGAMGDK